MNASSPSPTLPPPLLDRVLQQAPVDVLLFDTALVCRYAAPAEETLFGRTPEQLVGRHATEIFPPAADGLRPMLERAAQDAAGWRSPHYRYTYRESGSEMLFCWSIQVEPVAMENYRGVLVTLSDVQDLVDENDRLQAELEAQRTARRQLQTAVRTLLAPVMGYLQLIARRPHALRGRPAAAVIEERVLPRLREIVAAVDGPNAPPSDASHTTR